MTSVLGVNTIKNNIMGTWGAENFENDAHRIISEISEELFTEVIELLKDPQSAKYDEFNYPEFV